MKSSEFITESNNDVFSGNPEQYTFSKIQQKHYNNLKGILARNGKKFESIVASTYDATPAYNMPRYQLKSNPKIKLSGFEIENGYTYIRGQKIIISKDDIEPATVRLTTFAVQAPDFVWDKYEGQTAGGGQNSVIINGKTMKLSTFLELSPEEQDALINS